MKRVFYSIAVVLFFSWVLTFFVFHAGRGIHILFLLALVCWLHAIISIPQKKYYLRDMKGQEMQADAVKKRA